MSRERKHDERARARLAGKVAAERPLVIRADGRTYVLDPPPPESGALIFGDVEPFEAWLEKLGIGPWRGEVAAGSEGQAEGAAPAEAPRAKTKKTKKAKETTT